MPQLLTTGPYKFERANSDVQGGKHSYYMVKRESSQESANYYLTKNFKEFKKISNVSPEKNYNWLTSEVVRWKAENGELYEGILYKPENFNPSKKYPVIFNCYDKLTENWDGYIMPASSQGPINVPYFVSNGFLVLIPEIKSKSGDNIGSAATVCVEGAVKFLSKFPYVDISKIGINGHSFGGFLNNYILTHSKLFAAACTSAGVIDLVSFYGSLWGNGQSSTQEYAENRRIRLDGNLWLRQEKYLQADPILSLANVTSPVLLLNNKNDESTPFSQGVEFFTALRRLGKRAWMLQYDGQEHGVLGLASEDYTIRLKQFFDHYLKGAPAPIWMLDGIAAKDKGDKTGLELDTLGRTPGLGLVTSEEQKQIDSLKYKTKTTINLR